MPQLAQAKELIRLLDSSVEDFISSLPATEKQLFAKVITLAKQLDLTGDNIQVSVANTRLINQIQQEVDSIISSDAYIGNVKKYIDGFSGVDKAQQAYFSEITTAFSPPKVLAEIKNQITKDVSRGLTERGLGQKAADELTAILRLNVSEGGSYADFTEQLRDSILGTKEDSGILERNSRQLVTDSINQYSATYSQTVTSDLGLKWFQYTGSLIETSRPFCVACVEKRWIHESEFKTILNGNIDGKKVSLAGVNPETTPENFQILRGGFNCAHQLLPVSEDIVPREIRIALYESKNIPYDENGFAIGEQIDKIATAEELIADVKDAEPELKTATQNILDKTGADATPINFKSEASIIRKARDEYGGNIGLVKDAMRNTIIGERSEISSIIKAVKDEFGGAIINYKHQVADKYMGYSGDLFNIRFSNASIGEMQVNTAKMIYAKEDVVSAKRILGEDLWNTIKRETGQEGGLGHKYYEEWRLITEQDIIRNPSLISRKLELERLSKEYYSHFTD